MRGRSRPLTERQLKLLRLLYSMSRSMRVYTVEKSQDELARQLGITRQALNIHLRRLKEEGLIRTGRGFIDLTEKALKALGIQTATAFILINVEPRFRDIAYRKILELPLERLYRVAGEADLIAVVDQSRLDEILRSISSIEGVKRTSTLIVLEPLKE